MPNHFDLTPDSLADLERRADQGESSLVQTWGRAPHDDDRDSAARDTIANVLTAMYGPAGVHSPGGTHEPRETAQEEARRLLDRAFESWTGDAEDYTRHPAPGEYGFEEPEPDTRDAELVTLRLTAMEPGGLLARPSPVFVRLVGPDGMGDTVELWGTRALVRAFVATHWGDEEVNNYPEIATALTSC